MRTGNALRHFRAADIFAQMLTTSATIDAVSETNASVATINIWIKNWANDVTVSNAPTAIPVQESGAWIGLSGGKKKRNTTGTAGIASAAITPIHKKCLYVL